jgi:hypothetical protein
MTYEHSEGEGIPGAQEFAETARPHGGRLSNILAAVAADQSRERVSIADFFDVLSHRAFGALMLIFAAPNLLPTPPGVSSLLAAPLLLLATQLALSRPAPWLPRIIADRSISRADFASVVDKALPWLGRAERLLKPRLSFLTRAPFEQGVAIICLVLAVILFLPIPLGNILPAMAISLFSLAILERDGLAALSAAVVTAVSIIVAWGVIYALVKSAIFLVSNALAL